MNYSNLLKLGALLILPLMMWGCFEEQDFDLSDANQVEWAPPDPASSSLSDDIIFDADQTESEVHSYEVQLIGAQADEGRSVGVTVNEDASEAIEGEHFELQTTTVTISANSNNAEVDVEIMADAFENRDELFFQLVLQDGDKLRAAPNLAELDLEVEKLDVEFISDFEGTEDYKDVVGSIEVEGFAPEERFEADISLEGLAEQSSYEWALYRGTCEDMSDDVVGEEVDYPELETGEEETSASTEADVNVRIFQDDELNVRTYEDALLGESLVACQNL